MYQKFGLLSSPRNKFRQRLIICGVLLLLVVVIVVVVVTSIKKEKPKKHFNSKSYLAQEYKEAAVAADAKVCSTVGNNVLRRGGNAVDSAVATSFCLCVVQAQSTGIGGGGFMLLYERHSKTFTAYDFREVAPLAATELMFKNNPETSYVGGFSIAVPGMVKGMWEIHQAHGILKWADLLQPAIKLADEGFKMGKSLAETWTNKLTKSKNLSKPLKDLFKKKDGGWLQEGDWFVNKPLAKTLMELQMNNISSFYEGEIAKRIVKDVQLNGGVITLDDMKKYQVKKREHVDFNLPSKDKLTLNVMSAPSGGLVVGMIANILTGYDLSKVDQLDMKSNVAFYHKFIESMKFAFAQRGLLGDPDFLPPKNFSEVLAIMTSAKVAANIRQNKLWLNQTHNSSYYGGYWGKNDFGTSHFSILDKNGDAVAMTSSLNYGFGSLIYSPDTGIIYNNEMDDFSTPGLSNGYGYPPTLANYIRPGKRPLSSMSPCIVTDDSGDVRMVVGAAGGSRIITGTASVLIKKLFLNEDLGDAVASYRLHNQGVPNEISVNPDHPPPKGLMEGLAKLGHKCTDGSKSVVQAIYKAGNVIYAMSDPRKGGMPDGY